MSVQPVFSRRQPDSLADVLERVLDKGIVIAGDIVVNVLDIELLTLKLRLFIASADTAREMGMDWWTNDPFFSSQATPMEVERGDEEERRQVDERRDSRRPVRRRSNRELEEENSLLRERLAALESGDGREGGS
jgi:hypothetical protein